MEEALINYAGIDAMTNFGTFCGHIETVRIIYPEYALPIDYIKNVLHLPVPE